MEKSYKSKFETASKKDKENQRSKVDTKHRVKDKKSLKLLQVEPILKAVLPSQDV